MLRDVWGFRTYVPTRTLESHASRVRRKLAAAGLPGWVVNVWGVGYKLRHVLPLRLGSGTGVNLFHLSRVMGTSLTMIDRTYGHLVPDSDECVRGLLDAYDGEEGNALGWIAGKAGKSGFFGLTRLWDCSQVSESRKVRKERLLPFDRLACRWHREPVPVPRHP